MDVSDIYDVDKDKGKSIIEIRKKHEANER